MSLIKGNIDEIVEAVMNAPLNTPICDCDRCREDIRTALAKFVVEEEWISVEEQKPKNADKVLVSCEYGVTIAEYTSFANGNEMWYAVLQIGTYEDSGEAKQVTHWMPLPTTPKKGGDDEA